MTVQSTRYLSTSAQTWLTARGHVNACDTFLNFGSTNAKPTHASKLDPVPGRCRL